MLIHGQAAIESSPFLPLPCFFLGAEPGPDSEVAIEISLKSWTESKGESHIVPRDGNHWESMRLSDAVIMIKSTRTLLHKRAKEVGVKLPAPSQFKPTSIQRFMLSKKPDLSQYSEPLKSAFWPEKDLLFPCV